MIKQINIRNVQEATKLLELQKLSYVVEAELIGYSEIPTLKEDLKELQNSSELFYGYYIDGNLVGAISYKIEDDLLDIYRLMVNPNYFRKGIAKELLSFVFNNNKQIKKAIVSTGSNNYPAVTLYKQFGFKEIKKIEIENGIWLSKFSRKIIIEE